MGIRRSSVGAYWILVEAGRKVAEIAGDLGIRCLKRYVARELYYRLPHEPLA